MASAVGTDTVGADATQTARPSMRSGTAGCGRIFCWPARGLWRPLVVHNVGYMFLRAVLD
jgi:hypothetical protein